MVHINWKVTAAVIAGLGIGMLARATFFSAPDRPQLAINLFETICVPRALGARTVPSPQSRGLVEIGMDGEWADPSGALLLRITGQSCGVSDHLMLFADSERTAFQGQAETLIAARFPMLEPEPNHGLGTWDLFHMWMQYDREDPRRWGITLSRFNAERDAQDAQTALTVRGSAQP